METTMKQTHTILALFVAVLAFPMAAAGQDEQASAGAASKDQAIDNIVVVGQKSLAELRREVVKAEEGFYSVFNELNDEKDYDVRCFYESPTGSHLKNHVCRARFVTKAYSQHAVRAEDANIDCRQPGIANGVDQVRRSANPIYDETRGKRQQLKLRFLNENLNGCFSRKQPFALLENH